MGYMDAVYFAAKGTFSHGLGDGLLTYWLLIYSVIDWLMAIAIDGALIGVVSNSRGAGGCDSRFRLTQFWGLFKQTHLSG